MELPGIVYPKITITVDYINVVFVCIILHIHACGNYWSDYEEKYPDTAEIDGSGIWGTPYVIDENNQDNYPIIPEFPSVLILLLLFASTTLIVAVLPRKKTKKQMLN
jgi:hypothetical protein